ncbi:hypothetical protein T440DRAFT_483730 [Plenodomus tracheiphilus IPT5]|uniref:Uncharacterized protein n=1 Tax=Plenodomus tracheiphilus IPT5 TaxID=1408161 RepID=A0A6A7AP44_9PLEO|nr:hypothetical protein T440DRAFT_483730 [Plenodomus tracheiphilus IPT5]
MRLLFLRVAIAAIPILLRPTTGASPRTVTSHISFLEILNQVNASTPLDWARDQGTGVVVRRAFVDVDTWNTAKAALATTEAVNQSSELHSDNAGLLVPYNDISTFSDNIRLSLSCEDTDKHVSQAELFTHVPTIENQLRTRGGPAVGRYGTRRINSGHVPPGHHVHDIQ